MDVDAIAYERTNTNDLLRPSQDYAGHVLEQADVPKAAVAASVVALGGATSATSLKNELPPLPVDPNSSTREHSEMHQILAQTPEQNRPAEPENNELSALRSHSRTDQADTVIAQLARAGSPDFREVGEDQGRLPPLPSDIQNQQQTALLPPVIAVEPSVGTQQPGVNGLNTSVESGSSLADAKLLDAKREPRASDMTSNLPLERRIPATSLPNEPRDASLPSPMIENSTRTESRSDSLIPNRLNPASTLRPELKREVEMIVRKQEDELRQRQQAQGQPPTQVRDTIISDLRAQTQLDISRAPSPAEARPIKAIPVPEDWVPLPARTWVAQRKFWAAAATCHLPLYFQDPVLERYGHSVEQFVGPFGRFLTYPLDDPTQSTQRNQILQPFFSAGLFALQVAAWPYNLIMDPPWEAQYDLGYYRPGDNIPTDTYWLPLHGYGPLLRGSNY